MTSPAQTLRQLTGDEYGRAYNEAQVLRLMPRDDREGMTRSEAERRLLALIPPGRTAHAANEREGARPRGRPLAHRQLTRRPEALVARFATGLAPTV